MNIYIILISIITILIIIDIVIRMIVIGKIRTKMLMDNELLEADISWISQFYYMSKQGKSVADYLQSRGINNVSIIGVSTVGQVMIDELEEHSINIVSAFHDRSYEYKGISIERLDTKVGLEDFKRMNERGGIDAFIVTSHRMGKRFKSLNKDEGIPIISVKELIEASRNQS